MSPHLLLTSSRELDLFCFMPGRRRHRSCSRGGSAARLGPRSRNSAEARCGEEEEEPPATMIPCTPDTALDTVIKTADQSIPLKISFH